MLGLRLWIALAIVLSAVAMKWASLRISGLSPADARSVWLAPVLSVASWKKRRAAGERGTLWRTLVVSVCATGAWWWLYLLVVPRFELGTIVQGYLGAPILCGLLQIAGTLAQLLWLPSGWLYPPHMRVPFLARSIDEFWARRWGTYVADWARQVIVSRYRRQPARGAAAVFVASGVWHEIMIDVPMLIVCGVNLLGGWLLYFIIQAAGAFIEHRVFRQPSVARALFAWAVIAGPTPLAMNVATLTALGLRIP